MMNDKEKLKAIEELFLPLPEWVDLDFNTAMSINSSKMRKLREILQSSEQRVEQ